MLTDENVKAKMDIAFQTPRGLAQLRAELRLEYRPISKMGVVIKAIDVYAQARDWDLSNPKPYPGDQVKSNKWDSGLGTVISYPINVTGCDKGEVIVKWDLWTKPTSVESIEDLEFVEES